eukprot:Clim_evm72s156 gene=Clim_evmTU72s156
MRAGFIYFFAAVLCAVVNARSLFLDLDNVVINDAAATNAYATVAFLDDDGEEKGDTVSSPQRTLTSNVGDASGDLDYTFVLDVPVQATQLNIRVKADVTGMTDSVVGNITVSLSALDSTRTSATEALNTGDGTLTYVSALFGAEYSITECTGSAQTLTAEFGILFDGHGDYAANTDCTINLSNADGATLTFLQLDLGGGSDSLIIVLNADGGSDVGPGFVIAYRLNAETPTTDTTSSTTTTTTSSTTTTTTSSTASTSTGTDDNTSDGSDDGDGTTDSSTGSSSVDPVLIGSVAAGGVVVLVVCGYLFSRRQRKKRDQADEEGKIAVGEETEGRSRAGSYQQPEDSVEPSRVEAYVSYPDAIEEEGTPGLNAILMSMDTDDMNFIPPQNIDMGEELGRGAFGVVYKGTLIKSGIEVAIKTLNVENVGEKEIGELLAEAQLMSTLRHPYITGMIGLCKNPFSVVTEFMPMGDLKSFIAENPHLTDVDFGRYSWQIALAMVYMEGRHIVHRDLALRNILVYSRVMVKITDFGMSKTMAAEDTNYYQSRQAMLPVRWLAPECLERRKFSNKSDVWAYGVTVWEIYSRATRPYQGKTNLQVFEFLKGGERLQLPNEVDSGTKEMVADCFVWDEHLRPSFKQIVQRWLTRSNEDEREYYQEEIHKLQQAMTLDPSAIVYLDLQDEMAAPES